MEGKAPSEELRHSGLLALMHSPLSTQLSVLIDGLPFDRCPNRHDLARREAPLAFLHGAVFCSDRCYADTSEYSISHSDVPEFDDVQD